MATGGNNQHSEYVVLVAITCVICAAYTLGADWPEVWWVIGVALASGIAPTLYSARVQVRQAHTLGQYTLEEKLGEGSMGVVYRARHALLRRPTAVKLLPPDHCGEKSIARFEREVQRTAMLTHPNTVTVYEYGRTDDGVFYYAMELLDGIDLSELVDVDGPQPPARVIHILTQAAAALAEAHEAGLIHRDIKPANIVLVDRGGAHDHVKLVDFGLVKELSGEQAAALSNVDTITGTPQYISPEAITDPDEVGPRSDLYALGAVGYFLLTGEHVFEGRTVVEVCSHHLHSAPESPSSRLGSALPADLEGIVLDCLAKRPEDRPRTAAEAGRRLTACADAGRWSADDAKAWWTEYNPRHRHL